VCGRGRGGGYTFFLLLINLIYDFEAVQVGLKAYAFVTFVSMYNTSFTNLLCLRLNGKSNSDSVGKSRVQKSYLVSRNET